MTAAAIIALAMLAWMAAELHIERAQWARERARLLDRIQAPVIAEVQAAQVAWDAPPVETLDDAAEARLEAHRKATQRTGQEG